MRTLLPWRQMWSDGHISQQDKSFVTAPNETFIIHAVSFSTAPIMSDPLAVVKPTASDCQPTFIITGNIVSYAS